MANPSLQIGDSNWAIKEDNLLGYSTAGTRFVPQPIAMTRTTAGTRVNSSGLVETVELLGSELVVNGDFSSDTDWIKAPSGVTISGGSANFNSASDTYVYQDILTTTKTYKIIFSGTINSGSLYIGENGVATNTYTAGTYTNEVAYFTVASSSRFIIRKTGVGTLDATIDNISVKESTKNNLARVDYDGTASSLLVEPERTNLITYSEDFSDSSWLRAGSITTTDNYTTSPSGQNNATRLQWTNATNFIYQNVSHVGSDFTLSIYLKSNTGVSQNVRLFMDNGAQTTNVVVTTQWQRFEFTSTSTPTQSNRNTGLIKSSSQVGNLDISIWSAQFEEGSYPTSYIPTSGSAVTRNQEAYKKTGISNLINSEEGVLFVEGSALIEVGANNRHISISSGSNNDRFYFYYSTSGKFGFASFVGGVLQANITYDGIIANNSKVACKYKENDYALWIDGVEVGTDISASVWSSGTLDTLNFADANGGGSFFYGKVKQLQVFKTALTDPELAALTS